MRALVAGLLLLVVFAGCATPPAKLARTTVVLMPDEDGNVGAVSLTTGAGSRGIDQAYAVATVDGAQAPSAARIVGRDAVSGDYAALLKAQPPKPRTFTLHFVLDKSVLTEESKALIPAVLEAIRERKPTEITIFGHTDAVGSDRRNDKLSADRARVVAALLRKADPSLDRIDVQSFGDRVPLFPTDGRTPEPRNRRAEVMVL